MPEVTHYWRETANGLTLAIKVIPRASRNEIVGVFGTELRIRLTAPPVDAAANRQLIAFLSQRLNCPKNRLRLEKGAKSRHKTILILGATPETVLPHLEGTLK